jgi:hypothetical protein
MILASAFLCVLMPSCENDEIAIAEDINSINFNNIGYTVENGYLNFENFDAVDNYIKYVGESIDAINSNESVLKSTTDALSVPGFASLASKTKQLNDGHLKSSAVIDPTEEFFIELTKQLIPDEVIHYVVDTANQVKISGKMYQISPFGTFIYNQKDSLEYQKLCDEFIDIYNDFTSKIDSVTYTYGNITFIDSYGKIANTKEGEVLEDKLLCEIDGGYSTEGEYADQNSILKSTSVLKSASNRIMSSFTDTYNLTTYKAGAKTVAGTLINNLVGENNWREKKLDSKHRVKVKLYDVNYGFYKNQGFRVEYNELRDFTVKVVTIKRWRITTKRVTLWSYWSNSKTVPEMVVGIDYFQGYTEYELPLAEAYVQNIPNTVVETMTDYAIKMCYEGLVKTPVDIAKNWVTDLNVFKGVVFDLGSNSINNQVIIDKGFEAGMDFMRDELKGSTNKFIKKQINKASSTPIVVFTPDYKNGGFREYMILKGVYTYYNRSEVHVQIAQPSFGFKVGSKEGGKWKLVGFTPNKFNIDEAFIFGAVKHNGKWQGIRMYIN